MSVEAIAALSAGSSGGISAGPAIATSANALSSLQATQPALFDSLVAGMHDLSAQMQSNAQAVETLATGDATELHRVIMNLESTKLKFDLALQVRNKILDAYQELMRMQI
jgi:flagellar hook-basal body complex protein FliE